MSSNTSQAAPTEDEQRAAQAQDAVDRAIQRNIKGLELMNAPLAPVGLTPKDVIYERGTLRLYHYHPLSDEVYRIPVLLVMATTNKAFVFDLAPGQSMVEFLLKQGFDVFVIDWAAPLPEESDLTLEDYTQDFIPACIRKVQRESGETDINLIGYCQGGVLSLIYAATHPNGPMKNLVCLTTPVNFHKMGLNSVWSDERYFDVDKLVDTLGIISADFIAQGFEMQRPAAKLAGQLRLWDQMLDDEFVKSYRVFERWGNETLPLAGEYFRQTTKDLSWGNKLFTGELVVGGREAKLSNITVPLLAVVAEHDHLVPYDCSHPLQELVSSTDKTEIKLKGGHVSLIAGPNAVRRMWPKLDEWLAERSV